MTQKIPPSEGSVTLPLEEYLLLRDTINSLLETTKTHKEFLKDFRKSLIQIIQLCKSKDLDLDSMFEYYKNLDFKTIESLDLEYVKGEEDKPQWKLNIKVQQNDTQSSIINH